ncbi:serine hydrolase domain-containing protein [Pseudoalteromonas sp. T1lg21]|uniref:serine hydrolase domain-containing protein n=1 Tax=Pseudoalteromonas sp. T1lg21 TaxID=2077095 RepID=UPI000CF6B658|nr:serine hydrolase domain-containing protein [Pseudoalteromonas sp. T1lg21]
MNIFFKKLRLLVVFYLLAISSLAHSQNMQAEMADFINGFHNFKQFNGNVLVAKDGKVLFEQSVGYANFEWDIKHSNKSKFRIGSITKQFTAILILQLAQDGKLKLDDHLATYLPDYRQDIATKITLRQILNHTSGLGNYTQAKSFRDEYSRNPYSVDEFIRLLCSDDLVFEPGTDFRYSNSGYFILGAVIEKVTGQKYQDVLQKNILDPLDMKDTGYDSHNKIIKFRVSGYDNGLAGYSNTDYLDMSIPYAAGSMYSTARDLLKWDHALYTDKLLNNEYKKQMYHVSEQRNYALGWEVTSLDESTYGKALTRIQHGGGINGFNAFISRIIEDKLLVIILNNTGGAPLTPMTNGLLAIYYGKPYEKATEHADSKLYNAFKREGIAGLKNTYQQMVSEGNTPRERSLNYFGYELMQMDELDAAITVFELNNQSYPDSANTFDSLGEAYLAAGDKQKALASYKSALKLNPDSESAKQAIEKLQ